MNKKNNILFFSILIIVLAAVLFFGYNFSKNMNSSDQPQKLNESLTSPQDNNSIIGGDKDEHGCIGSAGYVWCKPKEKCIRIWEESCFDQAEGQIAFLLSNKFGKNAEDIKISIDQQDNSHIKGSYAIQGEKEERIFLVAKKGDLWLVVYDETGDLDCEAIRLHQFSPIMLESICQ